MKNNKLKIAFLLCVLANTSLQAVSGIGVATRLDGSLGNKYSVRFYKVTNNHVDTSYDISTDQSLASSPFVINTHGTHLAYVRPAGVNGANDQRLTVLRLSNPAKKTEIVSFGNDTAGRGWSQIAWPQGDWIYFTTAKKCNHLYRVNVLTRTVEYVAYINIPSSSNYGEEFRMSAIGNRMSCGGGIYFTIDQIKASKGKILDYKWDDGGYFAVQGCGHSLSPSGNEMGNQIDPGHYYRIVTPLNWQTHKLGTSVFFSPAFRNTISVDKNDPALACSLKVDPSSGEAPGYVETVGLGSSTYGEAYSVNSDKWELLVSGWAPDGREQGNGGNIVLWNYLDSISMNITRLPRRNNGASDKKVEPQCNLDPNWFFAGSPTFFVNAPATDILPELKADATTDYKIPGIDDNTQFPALTMLPKTPSGGFPPVGIQQRFLGNGHRGQQVFSNWQSVNASKVLQIDLKGMNGLRTVNIFDIKGKLINSRKLEGGKMHTITMNGIYAGMTILHVN